MRQFASVVSSQELKRRSSNKLRKKLPPEWALEAQLVPEDFYLVRSKSGHKNLAIYTGITASSGSKDNNVRAEVPVIAISSLMQVQPSNGSNQADELNDLTSDDVIVA